MKFPGINRLVIVTMIPGKLMEQLYLESISSHMKDKKIISSSQSGLPQFVFPTALRTPARPLDTPLGCLWLWGGEWGS